MFYRRAKGMGAIHAFSFPDDDGEDCRIKRGLEDNEDGRRLFWVAKREKLARETTKLSRWKKKKKLHTVICCRE